MSEFPSILIYCLIILNIFCSVFVLYYEIKKPEVIWAWTLIILIIPLGFLLYLVFGFEGRKHKVFLKKSISDEILFNEYVKNFSKNIKNLENNGSISSQIINFNINLCKSYLNKNQDVILFHTGEEKFDNLFKDIKNAKKFVHLEYYIIRNDFLGKKLIKILEEKAKVGVEVKLLYDGMGNIKNPKDFCKNIKKYGGKVKAFLSPYFFRVNYRNHRKICIIDGKIGYIGGFNIGKEYLGKGKKFKHWQDEHIKIVGDSVKDLEVRFISDWNFCCKNNIKDKITLSSKYFPVFDKSYINKNIKIQILNSGCDCKYDSIHSSFFKMITLAKKSIFIITPYFIPDESILTALKTAAVSGVKISIIFPAKPDHPFVYWANISYLGQLLKYKVKCYKYKKGFIHSKLILIDNEICSIGTANMDIRSLKLNFETNCFIYDKEITIKYLEKINEYKKYCDELKYEEYENRTRVTRLKEAVSRLVSPTL